MIVKGLQNPENEEANKENQLNVISAATEEAGIDKNCFKKHFDKIHPIGGTKNGNQARVIKFTKDSFKEKLFLQPKRNKKTDNRKKKKTPSARCG